MKQMHVGALVVGSMLALAAAGCSKNTKGPVMPPPAAQVEPTAEAPVAAPALRVDENIATACGLDQHKTAPHFAYDSSALDSDARDTLTRIAQCFTTGPMQGRGLSLVGHTDPRGEIEYNMTLGAHRADAAKRFLTDLGVAGSRIQASSRGKLDATGDNEAEWALDRRVDVDLAK